MHGARRRRDWTGEQQKFMSKYIEEQFAQERETYLPMTSERGSKLNHESDTNSKRVSRYPVVNLQPVMWTATRPAGIMCVTGRARPASRGNVLSN